MHKGANAPQLDPPKYRKTNRKYRKFKLIELKKYDCYGLGERMRKQRVAKGLSRAEVAAMAGIGEPFIASLEYGTKQPSVRTLFAISKGLDVPVQYLLTGKSFPGDEIIDDERFVIMKNIASLLSGCTLPEIESIEGVVAACVAGAVKKSRKRKETLLRYPSFMVVSSSPATPVNTPQSINRRQMAKRILQRREEIGLGRVDIMEYMDVSSTFAAAIESGERGMSMKNFHLLIQILDTTADHLLGGGITPVGFADKDTLLAAGKICEMALAGTTAQANCIFNIIKTCINAFRFCKGE